MDSNIQKISEPCRKIEELTGQKGEITTVKLKIPKEVRRLFKMMNEGHRRASKSKLVFGPVIFPKGE